MWRTFGVREQVLPAERPRGRTGAAVNGSSTMTDYWLSKLCYDLQNPALAAAYRADRAGTLDRYPLEPAVREALLADDVATLAPRVNAYLLRYYATASGMPEEQFLAKIRGAASVAGG